MSISSLRAASSGGAIAKPVIAKQAEEANNDIIFNTDTESKTPAQIKKEYLEKVFGELFRKYNYVADDVLATLAKITCDKNLSVESLESFDETKINNLLNAAQKAFDEIYNKDSQSLDTDKAINKAKQYYNYIKCGGSFEDFDNKDKVQTLSGKFADEILKYFEDKLEEYTKQNESTAQVELKKDFYRILAQTPDAEKNRLLPVLLTVLKEADDIEDFFNSFDDKNLRTQCADSIDNETLSRLNIEKNNEILSNILKNMSVERVDEYLKSVDDKYKEL